MAIHLGSDVHWLELGWPPPFGANAFLVDDGSVTLIDAGLPVSSPGIRSELNTAGYGVDDIDRVLVTHYDLDHVGGLHRLGPRLDATVYIGVNDLDLLERRSSPPLLHHKGLFHRGLRSVYRLPSLDYRPVEDGDVIGGFTAFHTPGHNPGHLVFVHEQLEAGLLGDLVWERDGSFTTPVWLDSYDMRTLRESIVRFAEESPTFEIAGIGHGEPLREGGYAALRSLADHLKTRIKESSGRARG